MMKLTFSYLLFAVIIGHALGQFYGYNPYMYGGNGMYGGGGHHHHHHHSHEDGMYGQGMYGGGMSPYYGRGMGGGMPMGGGQGGIQGALTGAMMGAMMGMGKK
uniref:Uncharacterized protein n=1 Tax=Panagrolaimus sp. ES5 TaxID=591445 RepID=A0AC34FJF1_9BILA